MNSTFIITGTTGTYIYSGSLIAATAFADYLFGTGNAKIEATINELPAGSYQKIA